MLAKSLSSEKCFAPTNLIIHDPSADNFQRAIIFSLSFPLYDHRTSWQTLRICAIEFLLNACNICAIPM